MGSLTAIKESDQEDYQKLNIEDLTNKIRAIIENEETALNERKSDSGRFFLCGICMVAFAVSSVAAVIFGSFL